MAAKFKIFKSSNRDYFYFRLVSLSDKTLLTSEGYHSKQGCVNGIESVKRHSEERRNYKVLQSINGKYFFNMIASNGQVIGRSEHFSSRIALDKTIDFVEGNAQGADIEDLTIEYN